MAFNLRSQSPLNQQKDPMDRFKTPNTKMQESLKESSKTVSNAKENKKTISLGDKLSQDWKNQNPIAKAAVQLADPTGTTSYPDVKQAWSDNK